MFSIIFQTIYIVIMSILNQKIKQVKRHVLKQICNIHLFKKNHLNVCIGYLSCTDIYAQIMSSDIALVILL